MLPFEALLAFDGGIAAYKEGKEHIQECLEHLNPSVDSDLPSFITYNAYSPYERQIYKQSATHGGDGYTLSTQEADMGMEMHPMIAV